jgi:hypothetical protein
MAKLFVNVYLVDRACGGREEGGWWYNYGEIQASYEYKGRSRRILKKAEKLVKELENGEFTNEGRKPIWSVNSDGEYRVCIEDKMGSDWSDYSPWE